MTNPTRYRHPSLLRALQEAPFVLSAFGVFSVAVVAFEFTLALGALFGIDHLVEARERLVAVIARQRHLGTSLVCCSSAIWLVNLARAFVRA